MNKYNKHIISLLNLTWGLVQTLLGFVLFLITLPFCSKVYIYEGSIVSRIKLSFGVSLGLFIISDLRRAHKTVKHEYGHCIQSMVLGPLYLLTVGVVSPSRNIWSRIMYKVKHIRKLLVLRWYYSGWPENWADKLGGVQR